MSERPPETQDALNRRVFHPLARRLALALAPTPVTPNLVSFFGFLMIAAAAFAYTGLPWPAAFLVGFPLHLLWHVFDGADGDLARMTGKSSPIGELVDGVCDYAGHILLYIVFAMMLDDRLGLWAWAMAAVAGGSRIVQSNFAESQRRTYLWRVYDVPWLKQNERAVKADKGLFARIFGVFVRGYVALSQSSGSRASDVDDRLAAFPAGSEEQAAAKALVREKERDLLPALSWIGQNPRTVLLGVSMAFGTPLWFFIAEATLLNGILIWAMRLERRTSKALAARLDALLAQARSRSLG